LPAESDGRPYGAWPRSTASRLISLLVLLAAHRVQAVSAGPDDLCRGDPCVIARDANVDVGGTLLLDFGPRRVVLDAVLTSGATALTILAGEFEIRSGGQIRGTRSVAVTADGNVVLNGTRGTGAVRLIGPDEATLALASRNGAVSAIGRIFLDTSDPASDAGTLTAAAATRIELRGEVTGSGGSLAGGGTIELQSGGDVTLGSVTLNGGEDDGGLLSIVAAGTVRCEGPLTLEGAGDQGAGGEIDVNAGGDVVFLQGVRLRGSTSGPSSCGDAGTLDVTAGGTLAIAAETDLRSRVGDCAGGTVEIDAGGVSLTADLLLDARGNDGSGGDLSIVAGAGFDCRALLDASGELGGNVSVETTSALSLAAPCVLRASGAAGRVDLTGAADVSVQGRIEAGAAGGREAEAAIIEVEGCRVSVEPGASLRSLGAGSENVLLAGATITVGGTMEAGAANRLVLPPGFTPVLAGSLTPAAQIVFDPEIIPCETPPPTPTSTSTPAATTPGAGTPTVTATATRPGGETPTATATASGSPSSPTPTPTSTALPACVCDCDTDGRVGLGELVTCVRIALGGLRLERCPSLDADRDGTVRIHEPIAAVAASLGDCGAAGAPQGIDRRVK
jgi:hypothetical protein